jgi:protein-disulfide isomerase
MRRSTLLLTASVLLLTACVDTTGVQKESTKGPRGNVNASVTLTEYGDFQCPACGAAETVLLEPLMATYGTRVRFEFKQFPLRGLHPYAQEAAEASECAADQGKFWEMHDIIYKNQKDLNSKNLRSWAEELKLDTHLFGRCLKSKLKRSVVQADYNAGEKLGVNSTPSFFINGEKVPTNDIETVSSMLDTALSRGTRPL